MPRPRILGGPRSKSRIVAENPAVKTPREIPFVDLEEPDCEIIKIDVDEDEEITASTSKVSKELKIVSSVVNASKKQNAKEYRGSHQNEIIPPIHPIFALQCIQNPSSSNAENVFKGQNVIMIMPVNSGGSETLNPTLCTVERIENPAELFKISAKSQLPINNDTRVVSEKSENVQSTINMRNSMKNRQQISQSCDNKTNDEYSHEEIVVISDHNSSIDETTSNVSVGSVEFSENYKNESSSRLGKKEKRRSNSWAKFSMIRELPETKSAADNQEASISSTKKLANRHLSISESDKSTKSNKSEDSSSFINSPQKSRKTDNFSKNRENSLVIAKESTKKCKDTIFSKIQCIVCKKIFIDRNELHRHATLVHRNIQILFCGRCNDSFFTQRELNEHRDDICKPKIPVKRKILKAIERKIFQVPQTDKHINSRKSKRPRNKIDNSKYKYVEEEVVNNTIGATKKALISAEIKQLVVPLARLNEIELQKYLKKSITRNDDKDEKSETIVKQKKRLTELEKLKRDSQSIITKKKTKSFIGRKKSKLVKQKLRKNSDKNKKQSKSDNVSEENINKYCETTDFRSIARPIDSDSDENTDKSAILDVTKIYQKKITANEVNRVIGIERDDTDDDEQPVIRKLTSRSSEASVVLLKNRKLRESTLEEHKDLSTKTQKQDIFYDRKDSVTKFVDSEILEEFDPEEFQEISESTANESVKERTENWQEKSLDSVSDITEKMLKSVTRKTYFPSKRKVSIALKSKNLTSYELCVMCKQLFTLMNKLSGQFEDNKAKRLSIKCPLCDLYFISMFYLREHIANHHLHCQSQKICKLARSSFVARYGVRTSVDTALNCETQVDLALECQRCAMKFSEDAELVDHVFTHHDLPIFAPETGAEVPEYLDHLPNYCFQTFSSESPSKIRRCDKNRLKSVDKEAADIPKTAGQSVLRCSLCDAFFPSCIEYILHVKNSHALLSKPQLTTDSEDTELTSTHTYTTSIEIPLAPDITVTEKTNTDCNELLKQLMSDDSQDVCDYTGEKLSKKLKKTQIKGQKSSESDKINGHLEVTDLFADSPIASWNDTGKSNSEPLASIEYEIGIDATTCKPISADFDVTDNIFASGDENNDYSLINQSSEASEIVNTDFESEKSVNNDSTIKNLESEKRKALLEILEPECNFERPSEEGTTKWPIECNKCDRKFPNQSSLNEHLFFLHDDSLKDTVLTNVAMQQSRLENPTESQQWHCDRCSHTFKLLQSYSRHRYFIHGDDEFVHVCENCCKVLSSVTMVNVHICTDVASYNCRTCDKTFPTGMSLRLHNMEKHIETNGSHFCKPCNKKFLTISMLKRHEKGKHRFLRPYRPRKSSPVRMATKMDVGNELDSGFDQEYVDMDGHDFNGEANTHRKRATNNRDMARKKTLRPEIGRENRLNRSATFIEEREIFQCRLCRLYCLSKATLKAHEMQSHRKMAELCRICERMHPKGKLLRHMIDLHIMPCKRSIDNEESMWNIGKSIEERDAEELVKMLGIKRFISMCEYQRFNQHVTESAINCPNCDSQFENSGSYKEHFFMIHDVMCAICNIEFKSGDKAAQHKIEEHKSMKRYIWFVDNTMAALTAATNFSAVAEQTFIRMISRDSDEESDQSDDELLDAIEEAEQLDQSAGLAENFNDMEDKKLLVVVTDEDLKKFQMGTEEPNIWGLAAKISSTCEELTPTDVKELLSVYFEK